MYIHKTAEVSEDSLIGEGTKIWNQAQIREGVIIGRGCVISKNVYIDHGVVIGNNVRIQNNSSIYNRATLEDGVFIGPHVCFTNHRVPRAIHPDGTPLAPNDWTPGHIHIKYGAAVGANTTILTDITIGRWALIGCGAIVTKDVPDYGLVVGCPARLIDYVCKCGLKFGDRRVCEDCNTQKPENRQVS